MLFQVWVLCRAVCPALSHFLRHPAFVAGLWPCIGVFYVQLHAKHGAVALPLWRVLPLRLAGVAQRFAVGAVYFVCYSCNLFRCHGVSFLLLLLRLLSGQGLTHRSTRTDERPPAGELIRWAAKASRAVRFLRSRSRLRG